MFSFHVLAHQTLKGHMPKDKFQQKVMVTCTFALIFSKVLGQYSNLEIVLVSNIQSGTEARSIMGDRCQKSTSMRSN